jgi:hypothetical protein
MQSRCLQVPLQFAAIAESGDIDADHAEPVGIAQEQFLDDRHGSAQVEHVERAQEPAPRLGNFDQREAPARLQDATDLPRQLAQLRGIERLHAKRGDDEVGAAGVDSVVEYVLLEQIDLCRIDAHRLIARAFDHGGRDIQARQARDSWTLAEQLRPRLASATHQVEPDRAIGQAAQMIDAAPAPALGEAERRKIVRVSIGCRNPVEQVPDIPRIVDVDFPIHDQLPPSASSTAAAIRTTGSVVERVLALPTLAISILRNAPTVTRGKYYRRRRLDSDQSRQLRTLSTGYGGGGG